MIVGSNRKYDVGGIYTPDLMVHGPDGAVPPQPLMVIRQSTFEEYYAAFCDHQVEIGNPSPSIGEVNAFLMQYGSLYFYEISTD